MNKWKLIVLTPALVFLAFRQPAGPAEKEECPAKEAASPEPRGTDDANVIQGLWSGPWGGGGGDGVTYQPVIAELLIKGNHVELYGFPNANRLTGTVRFDASAKRMYITPTAAAGGRSATTLNYRYQAKADELTLIDSDGRSIYLDKCRVAQNPLANVAVELVAASGINDAGDLLVSEFTVLRTGRGGTTYFEPVNRSLKTKEATVVLVQEAGLKKITVAEARDQIRESTPVVVAYRHDDRPVPHQLHALWKEMGSPEPDSEVVLQTYSRILRPGTLVFVLSAVENLVAP